MNLPPSAYKLAQALGALPGIGPKQATKLAIYLCGNNRQVAEQLSTQISKTLDSINVCLQCGNLAEEDLCTICQDTTRHNGQILVVESVLDLLAMESAQIYSGTYCVLNKLLSPLNGVLAADLRIHYILEKAADIQEIIFALPATVEGEMTSTYIQELVSQRLPGQISFTRLARGIAKGVSMEYTDPDTLSNAFNNRV